MTLVNANKDGHGPYRTSVEASTSEKVATNSIAVRQRGSGGGERCPVAAGVLGLVQRRVRAGEEHVRRLLAVPDRDARGEGLCRRRQRAQPVQQLDRLRALAVRHEQGEFLASVTGQQ